MRIDLVQDHRPALLKIRPTKAILPMISIFFTVSLSITSHHLHRHLRQRLAS
jgi:hypothetical protein